MVRADSVIVSRTTTYSGASTVISTFTYRTVTCCGAAFQPLRFEEMNPKNWSYNPETQASRFGLIPVRSPLLGDSTSLSIPPGTEMFQFPGFPLLAEYLLRGGFPHSDIPESTRISSSSGLFAGNRVLHRLQCQGIHRGPLVS